MSECVCAAVWHCLKCSLALLVCLKCNFSCNKLHVVFMCRVCFS